MKLMYSLATSTRPFRDSFFLGPLLGQCRQTTRNLVPVLLQLEVWSKLDSKRLHWSMGPASHGRDSLWTKRMMLNISERWRLTQTTEQVPLHKAVIQLWKTRPKSINLRTASNDWCSILIEGFRLIQFGQCPIKPMFLYYPVYDVTHKIGCHDYSYTAQCRFAPRWSVSLWQALISRLVLWPKFANLRWAERQAWKLPMMLSVFGSFFRSVTAARLTKLEILFFCCQSQYTTDAAKTPPNKLGVWQ